MTVTAPGHERRSASIGCGLMTSCRPRSRRPSSSSRRSSASASTGAVACRPVRTAPIARRSRKVGIQTTNPPVIPSRDRATGSTRSHIWSVRGLPVISSRSGGIPNASAWKPEKSRVLPTR